MPISYTKRGWTNNSPPAINAANLGAMDDGLKLAVDALNNMGDAGQQAVKEIGAAPASTTGGKLVNKITEAGYSLAPATGTSNLDNIADGTSYARLQKAKADALNAETQVAPTAAGAADANAIAAASGSTLGARLETLTGQAVTVVALTAGADWVDITGWMKATSSLHLVSSYETNSYGINLFVVGAGRNGACFVLGNTPSPKQVLSFQTVLSGDYTSHKLQCKAPTYNATVTVKTIMANP